MIQAPIKEISISYDQLYGTFSTVIIYNSGNKRTIRGYPEKLQKLVGNRTPKYVYNHEHGVTKVYEIR